jgi:hypothetical protein
VAERRAPTAAPRDPGLFETLAGDGRPLLYVVALSLLFAGGFALFLSASRQFLPQDLAFLNMTPEDLCRVSDCRVVDFMIHDRVAFGGSLMAVGLFYLWLTAFPLSRGEGWAWWAILVSGGLGFAGFMTYLGYGYLDTWHGIGTLLLVPLFAVGMWRSRTLLRVDRRLRDLVRAPTPWYGWQGRSGLGRSLMLAAALGMATSGAVIMLVGVTRVFVPQDLAFMQTTREALDAVNPRLVSLLAHDRAGFGGAVFTTGFTAALCLWFGTPSRSLRQTLVLSWAAASLSAVGIHVIVGYTDFLHLAPAALGATAFLAGLLLAYPAMDGARGRNEAAAPAEPR